MPTHSAATVSTALVVADGVVAIFTDETNEVGMFKEVSSIAPRIPPARVSLHESQNVRIRGIVVAVFFVAVVRYKGSMTYMLWPF